MKIKSVVSVLVMMMLLMSCGPGQKKSADGNKNSESIKFETETQNKDNAVPGAVLSVAMVKDSPLVGIFNEAMYKDGYDGDIIEWFLTNVILDIDENFEITDTGIATLNVDPENKKATIKIKDGMKWSDGQPIVADDVIYPYEVIGNKDYTGVRYSDESAKIVGMEEYKAGKASTISGIKKVDDKTVEISFKEMGQGIFTGGNGLLTYAMPKHYLKDVPIKDLEKSEKVRTKLVVAGPYTISSIVPGESIELKANPNYFRGKPKTEKVTLQVVNSQTITAAMKSGKYDLVFDIPTELYKIYKDFDNIETLGRQELYYSYLGFKMGKYDKAKGENVVNGYLNVQKNPDEKWHRTGDMGYINSNGQLVLLGRVKGRIQIGEKIYYPFAVETAFSFCEILKKSVLTSKNGKLYLLVERNSEYKGNLLENTEIMELKKKFEIFKIIETEIPMDKRHNSKTDYKKLEEIVEKI